MPKKDSLDFFNSQFLAVTFDDVLLKTRESRILPGEVSLETKFSKNVELKIPIVSAAMDTVTESAMAIKMAQIGGLGVIHKNLNPEQQTREVAKVKHHLHAVIEKPISIFPRQTVGEVLEMRNKKGYSFHTFPVVDENNRLIGIVTENDFDLCDDFSTLIEKIMTQDVITAAHHTDVKIAYEIMRKEKKKVLPLVTDEFKLTGMYVFRDAKRIVNSKFMLYNLDAKGRLKVAAAIGVGRDAIERLEKLLGEEVDAAVIDTAHADSDLVSKTIKQIKKDYHFVELVVGNISSGESAKRLADLGVDGIKVGQGPGSICTTRVIAGTGCPQIAAVYNCVRALEDKGYEIPICADGGIKYSGAITLAIGAGAHSVMLGNLLAGTEEAPGNIVLWKGGQWKDYRGMGSLGAMESNKGSRERYLQTGKSKDKLIPEGIEGLVPFRGKVEQIMEQYVGGLQSGMGYVGAENIEALREKAQFIMVTNAGQRESHPHDVEITKDSPNYHGVAV